ncbi:MAG: N-acetylmuramoyl-L-alanine amidase [Sulfurospirillaceae bacterium]|nr:N-acetylmuramoyl-L-alanine amidase [Sulfurospirillaceae bacterium]
MAKIIRTLAIIFSLSLMLVASSSYLDKVYSYDKKIEQADQSEMFRIFHSLQSIYIKSIINNDVTLKVATLKRLIKCSNILKLNAKNYENELSTLQANNKINPPIYKKQKTTVMHSAKATKDLPKLIDVSVNDYDVSLRFNKDITYDDVKTFGLVSKNKYKSVFDFNAIFATSSKIKTPKSLKDIRIARYNKNTVRLVLVSNKSINSKLNIDSSTIIINFKKHINKPTRIVNKFTNFSTFNPRNKIIVLDPGHGGKDSGAIGYKGRYEKRAVLRIALKCYKELKKRGYRVYMTRDKDYFVKLRNRTNFANNKHADLFISIHANAAPRKSQYLSSKGLETFFLSPARSNRSKRVAALENKADLEDMDYYSKNTFLNLINREKIVQANKMALDVQQGILRSVRQKYDIIDGGVRKAPFWVLVGAQMPAILIETGYITNPTEGTRLFNFHYEDLMAKGIANGVDSYFMKN